MSGVDTARCSPDLASVLSNKINLSESVETLAARFKSAKPFPHVVIDNLFPDRLLDELVGEMPPIHDDYWVHHNNEHEEKYGLRSAVELGPIGLHSRPFCTLRLFSTFFPN